MTTEVLKVSSKTNVTKLAGAIAGIVQKGNECEIVGIGAGPNNQAVKAMCIANRMLAPNGIVLSFRPGFSTLDLSGEENGKSEVTCIKFKVIVG